jgi:hypothetical protein
VQELQLLRLRAAKQHLISRAIASATPPDAKEADRPAGIRSRAGEAEEAPEALVDLLVILPPLLEARHSLSPEATRLLFSSPPLSELEALLPDLAALTSSSLRASALNLARIAHPSTNASYAHRHIAALSEDFASLLAKKAEAEQSLMDARLKTLTSLAELLQAYDLAIAQLIRILESKHGVVARSLELRASEVSLEAQRSEINVEETTSTLKKEMYTPETITALRNYAAHLRDAKIRSTERIRGLQAELGEYGVGVEGGDSKEKTMREMARVYREMSRQMGDVKGDLHRLQDT